jgi:16S rRNA (cytosine967-C5)-methyltransferase
MPNDEPVALSGTNKNHFERYLQYAESIISSFHGNQPFQSFLKKYFSLNKKHGSRDRKLITSLCYNYFRLGANASNKSDFKENLLLGIFLCETNSSALLNFFHPAWNSSIQLPLAEKIFLAGKNFDLGKIFSFKDLLSHEISFEKYSSSFLVQPKLFIRIRPGHTEDVTRKITDKGFPFEVINENFVAFSNNEKVSNALAIDKEAVVQDYNSQKTLDILPPGIKNSKQEITIWDCCAGSGGKSILALDLFQRCDLTVTDKRKNILDNLKLRFKTAAIVNYQSICTDLEKSGPPFDFAFDLIVADVPCTGSGTWSRTPEQLVFFHKKELEKYVSAQKSIIKNAIPQLKNNGYLLYITCSVFSKENEENVAFIEQNFNLLLISMQYLKGYEMQADTLFVALFKKL